MAAISFVTTCKGRLAHLQQTLPRMVAQGADCEVVVVDYDCPDGTTNWVARHHPGVRRVEVTRQPGFHKARALNLGAKAASAPWLMFVDADILLAPDFAAQIRPLLILGRFLRPEPLVADAWGSCLVRRDDFLAVGGYDEVLQGWGGEDDDMYYRLQQFGGCFPATFSGDLLSALPHDDRARTRFYAVGNRWQSQRSNALYLNIKYDLTRLAGGVPSRALLDVIYAEVKRATVQSTPAAGGRIQLRVHLAEGSLVPLQGATLEREILYTLQLRPDHVAP